MRSLEIFSSLEEKPIFFLFWQIKSQLKHRNQILFPIYHYHLRGKGPLVSLSMSKHPFSQSNLFSFYSLNFVPIFEKWANLKFNQNKLTNLNPLFVFMPFLRNQKHSPSQSPIYLPKKGFTFQEHQSNFRLFNSSKAEQVLEISNFSRIRVPFSFETQRQNLQLSHSMDQRNLLRFW